MDIINYTKKFDTFNDGLNELTKLVPDVLSYISYKDDDSLKDEKSVIEELVSRYLTNMAVSSNPNFPYTYSFSSNRFGVEFGTDKRIRFGWSHKIFPEKEYYIFKVTVPNAIVKSNCEKDLLDNGWSSRVITNTKHSKTKKSDEA